jgi:hypothetical protein
VNEISYIELLNFRLFRTTDLFYARLERKVIRRLVGGMLVIGTGITVDMLEKNRTPVGASLHEVM